VPVEPTTSPERIVALDVLRGVAVLGILVMNVQSFSMIEAAFEIIEFPLAMLVGAGVYEGNQEEARNLKWPGRNSASP